CRTVRGPLLRCPSDRSAAGTPYPEDRIQRRREPGCHLVRSRGSPPAAAPAPASPQRAGGGLSRGLRPPSVRRRCHAPTEPAACPCPPAPTSPSAARPTSAACR